MSANAARGGGSIASSGGGTGAASASAGRVGEGAAGAAAGPAGVAVAALQALHKTINAVASRMEQQAGHAGLEGANPTAYPGGYPSYARSVFPAPPQPRVGLLQLKQPGQRSFQPRAHRFDRHGRVRRKGVI